MGSRGSCKYFLRQYEEAIQDSDKAIEIDPKEAASWYFRGKSKYFLDQFEEAIQDFDKAIEIDPEKSSAWESRGFAYLSMLNYKLAENNFKKVYEIDKDEGNLNINLGKIFYCKKDYYVAIKHYLDVLKLNPNNYISYANISLAKFELGDFTGSYYDIKKSEELNNKQTGVGFFSIFDFKELNKVMKIYEENNDLERFEQILDYINKDNKNKINLLSRGILQFKKGDFYSAISILLEVYEVDNQNKECILYLGKAKLALKDYKNALVDFEKYKELGSNDEIDELIKTCEENLKNNE